jgi:hypothetical protein
VSVLATPHVRRIGLRSSPLARWLLRTRSTRYLMRSLYALRAGLVLKRTALDPARSDYWQAGKSVAAIDTIEPAGEIVRRLARAAAMHLDLSAASTGRQG